MTAAQREEYARQLTDAGCGCGCGLLVDNEPLPAFWVGLWCAVPAGLLLWALIGLTAWLVTR